ncbi:MAG: outer membrane beta-barrel protein [Desulfobaccales bacterium]
MLKTKPGFKLLAFLALAGLLLSVMPARAEMYVEAYLGGTFAGSASDSISGNWFDPTGGGPFSFNSTGHIDPAVMGGLKIGTWFVKEGFLGMNYPDWMKYLGFYLDFSYHRLNFRRGKGTWNNPTVPESFVDTFFSEGTAATLAFMFAARYGFFPDSEVPFGRLQPYVAVGPALLFSTQQPAFFSVPGPTTWSLKGPSQSSADIALAVEAGLRWMALKNVSLDASFKYRYANPSYSYSGVVDSLGAVNSFTFSPAYNLFSFQVGAAYHF